ncbi:uncharacterized protein LOC62_02G002646 [Vanrija pseudolonga]|uniref:DUF1990 domain-containing protein n=1 Tax=Vanrija pseudolonga TaxID=143232 RepID=A0AAF1BIT8_9TREE|nr:hypothetical protein LOC62_02G002646 [Vanrija pseudolonga]
MHRVAITSLAVAAAGTAYIAYEARRLAHLYPIQGPRPYHSTPAVLGRTKLPPTLEGNIDPHINDYVYATIPLPPAAGTIAANATDAWVRAFYQTWTLRLEAVVGGRSDFIKTHCAELRQTSPERLDATSAFGEGRAVVDRPAPPAIAAGLFPVLERAPNLVVYFRIPSGGFLLGGTQELAAVPVDGGLELSYGCTIAPNPHRAMPGWVYAGHLFYMRFLVDRGARRLERWIAEDARGRA